MISIPSPTTAITAAILFITLTTLSNITPSLAAPQRSAFGNDDVNKYLSNPKYVEQQIDCVLDRSGCDSIGRNLKAAIPLALRENCRACSSKQVENARKLGSYISQHYPREWSQIQAKYGAGK
uniref:Ejaculatory bulb-specific protein 3 n=1 Tax=Cacopsylla melanoneura TaxID=428564 RepID=A0A8D8ZAX7_9HEMI